MSDKLFLYPRGILSKYADTTEGNDRALLAEGVTYVNGSQSITELMARYSASTNSQNNIICCELAAAWVRHTGDLFSDWVILQEYYANSKVIDFIKDTIQFINGGVRAMNIYTWASLVTDDINHATNAKRSTIDFSCFKNDIDNLEIATRWLTQQNGMDDLMITMSILFGKEKEIYKSEAVSAYGNLGILSVKPGIS